jgi:hypothetical protein
LQHAQCVRHSLPFTLVPSPCAPPHQTLFQLPPHCQEQSGYLGDGGSGSKRVNLGESQEAKRRLVVAFSVNFLVLVLADPLSGACAAEAKTCSVTRAACLLLQHIAADATLSTALFCKIRAERHGIGPKRGRERGGRDNARLHSVIVGYYLRSLVNSKRAIVTCLSCHLKRVVDSGTSRRSTMGKPNKAVTNSRFVRGDSVPDLR